MRSPQPLKDEVYHAELDRMRMLPRFPEIPAARQELIRSLRQVTGNREFLHSLITHFVDHAEHCPTVSELSDRARIMRYADHAHTGNAACSQCGGTGWVRGVRTIKVPGMEPYEAEYSKRCQCALVAR
jgi:hypothetical protein